MITRTAPPVVLIALEDYDTAIGRLMMNSKGERGEITPWIKAFPQFPLRWGGCGCSSSADVMLIIRANVSSWIAVRTNLEILYPGTEEFMRIGPGPLADQFHTTLQEIQSKVDAAREAMDALPYWKQIPKPLLARTELDLVYTEELVNAPLPDGVNAPYNRPQRPFASASNVINWHEVMSTGTQEQHSWLLAGAQVGGGHGLSPAIVAT